MHVCTHIYIYILKHNLLGVYNAPYMLFSRLCLAHSSKSENSKDIASTADSIIEGLFAASEHASGHSMLKWSKPDREFELIAKPLPRQASQVSRRGLRMQAFPKYPPLQISLIYNFIDKIM